VREWVRVIRRGILFRSCAHSGQLPVTLQSTIIGALRRIVCWGANASSANHQLEEMIGNLT
jgi:hypothetical protein